MTTFDQSYWYMTSKSLSGSDITFGISWCGLVILPPQQGSWRCGELDPKQCSLTSLSPVNFVMSQT